MPFFTNYITGNETYSLRGYMEYMKKLGTHYHKVKPKTVLHFYKTDLEWGKKTRQTDEAQKYKAEFALQEAKSISLSQVSFIREDIFGSSSDASEPSEPSGAQFVFNGNTFNGNVVNINTDNSLTPAEQNKDLHNPKKRRTVEDETSKQHSELMNSQGSTNTNTTDSSFDDNLASLNYGEAYKKRPYTLQLNEFGKRFPQNNTILYMDNELSLDERLGLSYIKYQNGSLLELIEPLLLSNEIYNESRTWRRSIASRIDYFPPPAIKEGVSNESNEDLKTRRDIFNMLLNIKQSIERPVINKKKKSEIDFIVKNVAPFLDSIFNSNIYIEWEKASTINTTSEGCIIRTDFLLYDTYQELGCGEVKVGNVSDKMLEEDRGRLGEMLKKQLHDRIFNAKTKNEFKTFGFFIYNSTIEIYTCEFTINKEYAFVLLKSITLPTLKTTYTSMEETLETMMSFKEMIIDSKHDERLCEEPYIYHDYIGFLKPTVTMM